MQKFKVLRFINTVALVFIFISSTFALNLNDNGKISSTTVSEVIQVNSELDILKAIETAKKEHRHISIMAMQHSQGGHSLSNRAIELNMLTFNKVVGIDTHKKQVTVQSGITWAELQKYINPYNLAIKSMQSPNIFSVGGSMSVNAHGDDFRAGAVGNSVVAFHLLLASGKKVFVTPESESTLWKSVIGGYGLIGVVTDVTLQLTNNDWLLSNFHEMELDKFSTFFRKKIAGDKNMSLFYAHLNIVPGPEFLRTMYVITYADTHQLSQEVIALDNPDKWNNLLTPIFNISRQGKLGKKWRWNMEKKVFSGLYKNKTLTRNNAMEKPVRFALNHRNENSADWLQEYFIPVDQLPVFMNILRTIMLENKVNLLNVTIRYVPAETSILLSYAKTNCFAVVLYFNQSLSEDAVRFTQSWTRQLINGAFSVGGNYYLPYQLLASQEQFRAGYPEYLEFLKVKHKYDPEGLFSSWFYQRYFNDH